MSQPGQLSHGMPRRDPITQLARRITDLERQLREMQGMIVPAGQSGYQAHQAIADMTAKNWFASSFSISTGGTDAINQNVTVPTGYTQCGIMLVGSAAAINSGPSADNLTISLKAATLTSGGNYASSSGGTGTTASVGTEWTYAGAIGGDPTNPGRTLNVRVHLSTQNANWATSAGNWAQLAILAIWQP